MALLRQSPKGALIKGSFNKAGLFARQRQYAFNLVKIYMRLGKTNEADKLLDGLK